MKKGWLVFVGIMEFEILEFENFGMLNFATKAGTWCGQCCKSRVAMTIESRYKLIEKRKYLPRSRYIWNEKTPPKPSVKHYRSNVNNISFLFCLPSDKMEPTFQPTMFTKYPGNQTFQFRRVEYIVYIHIYIVYTHNIYVYIVTVARLEHHLWLVDRD